MVSNDEMIEASDDELMNAEAVSINPHPLLYTILDSLVDEVALRSSKFTNASVITPVTDVKIRWQPDGDMQEVRFSGRLEHDGRLYVNVSVDKYYLDPEFNRLTDEILDAGQTLKDMADKMLEPLATELRTLANDILQDRLEDIHVNVHAWLFVDDTDGDPEEHGEHFEEIATDAQWYDFLDNHIWGLINKDKEWAELMADGMSGDETSEEEDD